MKQYIIEEVASYIKNDDLKDFFINKCLPLVNSYFWEVPASSSMRYHPRYACTVPYGLAKHTLALVKFLNHFFEVESVSNQFTDREKDLLIIAGFMHDTYKSGSQQDYEKSKWTKFDHPLIAASKIRQLEGIQKAEIEFIAHAIESHMGQWCTDKRNPNVVLPKPIDKYQIILHVADYLASRKDIEMLFDYKDEAEEQVNPEIIPNPDDVYFDPKRHILPFGKYKGSTLGEVYEKDKGYLEWLLNNISSGQTTAMIRRLFDLEKEVPSK